MVIGIIGADDRAVTIARLLRKCGHTVSFSDPGGLDHAEKAVAALADQGVKAESPYEQAAVSEALILAIHWEDMDKTLHQLGDYKNGVVIDAMRPPRVAGAENSAVTLEKKLDNRHVVKAFVEELIPNTEVMIASDDPEARMMVCEIVNSCGGKAVDVGALAEAAKIEEQFAERTKAIRGTV